MIVGLVPVWKDLSINLWAIAALNPDLFDSFFPFLVESQVVLIWQNGNFFSRLLFCLLAAHSTSSAQQNPSSTSSQDHQETGLHRFRNCTVNKDADSRTKQHTDNTTKTTSPPPTPHIPCSLSQLDKMNTSLQPAPSYHHFFYFFSPLSCFDFSIFFVWSWCSLQQGACCTDE